MLPQLPTIMCDGIPVGAIMQADILRGPETPGRQEIGSAPDPLQGALQRTSKMQGQSDPQRGGQTCTPVSCRRSLKGRSQIGVVRQPRCGGDGPRLVPAGSHVGRAPAFGRPRPRPRCRSRWCRARHLGLAPRFPAQPGSGPGTPCGCARPRQSRLAWHIGQFAMCPRTCRRPSPAPGAVCRLTH
jgi:hypothetical protein